MTTLPSHRINEFAQFAAPVTIPDGSVLKLHFVHERASKPNARTILLLHGWPGSYLEFLEVIRILKATGDYNIVAPSHPGYAFSDPPPADKEFGKADVAEYMQALMEGLGYKTYAVQVRSDYIVITCLADRFSRRLVIGERPSRGFSPSSSTR